MQIQQYVEENFFIASCAIDTTRNFQAIMIQYASIIINIHTNIEVGILQYFPN